MQLAEGGCGRHRRKKEGQRRKGPERRNAGVVTERWREKRRKWRSREGV